MHFFKKVAQFLGAVFLFSSWSWLTAFADFSYSKEIDSKKIFDQEISSCVAPCQYNWVKLHRDREISFDAYYTVEGKIDEKNNRIPVILLHGGGLTSNMYLSLGQALVRENFQVWKMDTRGHGLSSNPSGAFSYDLLAQDVDEFIRAHQIKKPILIGYSDGGITALNFVVKFPKVARAIISIAAAPVPRDLTHYMKGMEYYYGDRPKGATDAQWLASLLVSDKMIEHYTARHLDGMKLLKTAWQTWVDPAPIDWADLAQIKAPVGVILGNHDEFFTPENGQNLQKAIPQAQLSLIEGTHIFFRKDPAFFERVVLEMLRSFLRR